LVVLNSPLEYDQKAHPPEHCIYEYNLRNEFEEEVNPVLVLDGVEPFQDYTEGHLAHAQDDSQLHFETVHEGYFFSRSQPHRVKPERLHTLLVNPNLLDALQLVA